MWSLLAFLACSGPETPASSSDAQPGTPPPPAAEAPPPAVSVSELAPMVTTDCFSMPAGDDGLIIGLLGTTGAGGGGGGYGASPGIGIHSVGGASGGGAGGATGGRLGGGGPGAVAPVTAPTASVPVKRAAAPAREKAAAPVAGVRAEGWGETLHISNDDSMSLASAQRVLWALEQGRPLKTSQVRPHELLNYFPFQTVPPAAGELFSVTATARQTGDRLALAVAVQAAMPARLPLDLTLVLDRSGSMSAEGRMGYLIRGLRVLERQLVPGDRVDLLLFDHEACPALTGFVVGRDPPAVLSDTIGKLAPRGSTDVGAGLQKAYSLLAERKDIAGRNRRILLVTDALMNAGEVNPDLVSEVGRAYDENRVRVSGIGVGWEFNDEFLDKLTEKGRGPYVFLGSEGVVDRVFGAGFRSLTQTVAEDVRFSMDLPDSLALQRFYGEEVSTHEADIQPIHYQAGTSQVFLQDLLVRDGTLMPNDRLTFLIRWRDPVDGSEQSKSVELVLGKLVEEPDANLRLAEAAMALADLVYTGASGGDACGEPRKKLTTSMGLVDSAELRAALADVERECADGAWSAPVTETVSVQSAIRGVSVAGGLDVAAVTAVVRRSQSQLRYCFERQLVQDPQIGKVEVDLSWTVGPEGRVQDVQFASDKPMPAADSCLVSRPRVWRFPESEGESTVELTLEFQ